MLQILSVKTLAPKLDNYDVHKLLDVGGRAIATASVGRNVWLQLKHAELHGATSCCPLEREEDDLGWVVPGTSLIETIASQKPDCTVDLVTLGCTPFGGAGQPWLKGMGPVGVYKACIVPCTNSKDPFRAPFL